MLASTTHTSTSDYYKIKLFPQWEICALPKLRYTQHKEQQQFKGDIKYKNFIHYVKKHLKIQICSVKAYANVM